MWKFYSLSRSVRHSLTFKMMQSSIHWQLNVFPKRWNSSRKESEDWRHHRELRCQKQRIPQRQIRLLAASKSEKGIFQPSPMIKESSVMFYTIDELTFAAVLFTLLSPSFYSLLFCCTFHPSFKNEGEHSLSFTDAYAPATRDTTFSSLLFAFSRAISILMTESRAQTTRQRVVISVYHRMKLICIFVFSSFFPSWFLQNFFPPAIFTPDFWM